MTVSKTLLSLINEGVLYRERGKGTFVAKSKENHRLEGLMSFTEDMQKKGMNTETKMLEFKRMPATKHLDKKLQLPNTNKDVFKITRLRCCDGEPYGLETVYLAAYLCEGLSQEIVENHSLYEVLDRELDVIICVDNGANAAVIGEYNFGIGKGKQNIAYINCGVGIRTGIISSGILIRTINFILFKERKHGETYAKAMGTR